MTKIQNRLGKWIHENGFMNGLEDACLKTTINHLLETISNTTVTINKLLNTALKLVRASIKFTLSIMSDCKPRKQAKIQASRLVEEMMLLGFAFRLIITISCFSVQRGHGQASRSLHLVALADKAGCYNRLNTTICYNLF